MEVRRGDGNERIHMIQAKAGVLVQKGEAIDMILIEIIYNLSFLFFFVVLIVGNMMRLIALFKCLGKRECNDRSCHLKALCHRYQETITQEDVGCLTEMLNARRNELEKDNS